MSYQVSQNGLLHLTLTGFEPFGSYMENTSEKVMRYISSYDWNFSGTISTCIFPVTYKDADQWLQKIVEEETHPQVFILTGVCPSSYTSLRIERIAYNLDDSNDSDNNGEVRKSQPILTQGTLGYISELPLDEFANHLTKIGIPAEVSEFAGSFLCNHYYFRALHMKENSKQPKEVLFVHIPDLTGQKHQKLSIESVSSGLIILAELISKTLYYKTDSLRA